MRFRSPLACIRLFVTGLLPALALISACAGRQVPPASPAATAPVPVAAPAAATAPVSVPASASAPAPKPKEVYRETGTAGWYGKDLHGKKTASGEVFDMNGLSAAHRTLPLGTVIHVPTSIIPKVYR